MGTLTCAVLFVPCGGVQAEDPHSPSDKSAVRVIFLANEGFMFVSDSARVLIDGFIIRPYSQYGSVPVLEFERMCKAEAPFEHIDVALASHMHSDHIQPDAALQFLRSHPETELLSSPPC